MTARPHALQALETEDGKQVTVALIRTKRQVDYITLMMNGLSQ